MTATTVPVVRTAIYNRVSTRDQAEHGHNLVGDVQRCEERIEREPDWVLVDTYVDPALQGDDPNRPEYLRLLRDAGAGRLDLVLIPALDRFGRDAIETKTRLAMFEGEGIRVVSLREGELEPTPEGKFMSGIMAEAAQLEKAKIKGRVTTGIAARAWMTGKPWGGIAYGLRRTADGDSEWDPGERPTVERIFQLRQAGMTKSGIARQLTRDQVPTRKGATMWSPIIVSKILRGREPLGEIYVGGEWRPGRHEPILTEDAWRAVQALDEQSRKYSPGGRSGRVSARHLFVRGMLRCVCGEAMLPRSAADQADVYVCRAHKRDAATCPVSPLRRSIIDSAALAMFEDVALDLDATRDHITRQLTSRSAEVSALLQRAEREAAVATERFQRVQRAFQDGHIEAVDWSEQRTQLIEERDAADAELARLRTQANRITNDLADVDAESETLRRWAALRAAVAGRVNEAADVLPLRAALSAVCTSVTLRTVEEGAIVLDYHPAGEDWQRVGVGFPAAVEKKASGSGVPL
jgi:DNA invertase Pin-like site-specific DNA recombinase